MYENNTFEIILKRMLDRVPDNMDKREGSVIYDALAPAAAELSKMYIDMDVNLGLSFASTASGKYLEKRTEEMGIVRLGAAKARKKGLFYASGNSQVDIPIGSRFAAESLNYTAVDRLSEGVYVMECEIAGTAGNAPAGPMLPIDYVPGLARAELGELLEPGNDKESDGKLLERYQLRVRQPATSGNVHQYRQWALEVPGVGDAKVFPLWNGPGSVKVVIVDEDKRPAGSTLLEEAANYMEKMRPIGADVTVVSGKGKSINISTTVVLASGYTLQGVSNAFSTAVSEYFKNIAFEMSYISYARIGTILLGVPGVIDYSSLKLNGTTANVGLQSEEIPVLGTVDLEV